MATDREEIPRAAKGCRASLAGGESQGRGRDGRDALAAALVGFPALR